IHEGRYRQVRRMCEAVGLRVLSLHRAAYGPLRLGALARGMWRELAAEEVAALKAAARPRAGGPRGFQSARAGRRAMKRAAAEAPAVRVGDRAPPRGRCHDSATDGLVVRVVDRAPPRGRRHDSATDGTVARVVNRAPPRGRCHDSATDGTVARVVDRAPPRG